MLVWPWPDSRSTSRSRGFWTSDNWRSRECWRRWPQPPCGAFWFLVHTCTYVCTHILILKGKIKAFPYSIRSVGPGADPGVQAVSPQVTVSHPLGSRLQLLSARSADTFPATEHHRPLAGTKLHCLVTEARRCEQLAQACYAVLPCVWFEPVTYWSQVQRSTRCTTMPPIILRGR